MVQHLVTAPEGASQPWRQRPVISLCVGVKGQLSRVLNTYLTPATHSALPAAAAPGQLSVPVLNQLRTTLGALPQRTYHLFGASSIAMSPSPAMHNAGFKALSLPHEYTLCAGPEGESMADGVARVKAALSKRDCGGGNVTIPFKQEALALVDDLSPAAKVIGAVNTLRVVQRDGSRRVEGYNTDWIGIAGPIREQLGALASQGKSRTGKAGLVVGAGGTARAAVYALRKIGLQAHIVNRTPEKAQSLAEELSGKLGGHVQAVSEPQSVEELQDIAAVVWTVPGTAQDWAAPHVESLLQKRDAGLLPAVVVDVAYTPRDTTASRQAEANGAVVIRGLRMLEAQGVAGFSLWTGGMAPERIMCAAAECFYDANVPA